MAGDVFCLIKYPCLLWEELKLRKKPQEVSDLDDQQGALIPYGLLAKTLRFARIEI